MGVDAAKEERAAAATVGGVINLGAPAAPRQSRAAEAERRWMRCGGILAVGGREEAPVDQAAAEEYSVGVSTGSRSSKGRLGVSGMSWDN